MISLLTAVPFLLWSASALAQWNVIYENDGNVTYMDDDSLRIVEILDFGRTCQLTMTNIQEILSANSCSEPSTLYVRSRPVYHYICRDSIQVFLADGSAGPLQFGGICTEKKDCDAMENFVKEYLKKPD